MPRIALTLALLALLLGGCAQEQVTDEEYAALMALADTIQAQHDSIVIQHDTLMASLREIWGFPCPPCPDTVYAFKRPDSTKVIEGGKEIHFSSPDTVYQDTLYIIIQPPPTPGVWVKPGQMMIMCPECNTRIITNLDDALYQMPPGQWVKVTRWYASKGLLQDTAYHHSGDFDFYDKEIQPCPDSAYVLDGDPRP